MKIILQKGDYLWSKNGTHLCDELGVAIKADRTMEVEVDDVHIDRILPIIKQTRRHEGLIVDFGISHLD
jgi:hypothetical protein